MREKEIPTSLTNYIEITQRVPEDLEHTLQQDTGRAVEMLRKAKRVFFTGSGSSLPAALLGAQYLTVNTDKSALFANPFLILENKHLTPNDLIILISQGWSRADATRVTERIRQQSQAELLVYTGNPERNPEPTSDRLATQTIFPRTEKLFCRPGSVVTSYAAVADLVLQATTGKRLDTKRALAAWEQGQNESGEAALAANHIVVLAAGLALPGAHNAQLSLREGAGKHAEVHTIEDYGHGQYVTDQLRLQYDPRSTGYLVIAHQDDPYSLQAAGRIAPLLDGTHSPQRKWITPYDALYGNFEIFSRVSTLVAKLNSVSRFDMNEPPGKEENRPFHED